MPTGVTDLKYVKGLCWVMVLIWLSVAAFNAVIGLYIEGGFARILIWALMFTGTSLWIFGLWRAFKITKNKHNEKD